MPGPPARIAVLGGGIAGAAACLALARAGETPVWIAPPAQAGDKPGEHLAPAARAVLAALGAADLLEGPAHRPANVVLSSWGTDRLVERHAMVHLEGPATVLDRRRFEAELAARAVAGGARRTDATADRVLRADGAWIVEAGGTPVQARFLIDATGRRSLVGRVCASRVRADRLAAVVAFLEQPPGAEVEPSRATVIEASVDGWWYAALLPDGRLALNLYTDADLVPAAAQRFDAVQDRLRQTRYVGRWIEDAGFRFVGAPTVASAGTAWLACAAGIDWAAVGDAAAAFDPLSSHGMTTALWSAVTAARAAIAGLAGEPGALQAYAGEVASGVQSFLAAQRGVYGAEQRFSDSVFWQRRHGRARLDGVGTAD